MAPLRPDAFTGGTWRYGDSGHSQSRIGSPSCIGSQSGYEVAIRHEFAMRHGVCQSVMGVQHHVHHPSIFLTDGKRLAGPCGPNAMQSALVERHGTVL